MARMQGPRHSPLSACVPTLLVCNDHGVCGYDFDAGGDKGQAKCFCEQGWMGDNCGLSDCLIVRSICRSASCIWRPSLTRNKAQSIRPARSCPWARVPPRVALRIPAPIDNNGRPGLCRQQREVQTWWYHSCQTHKRSEQGQGNSVLALDQVGRVR